MGEFLTSWMLLSGSMRRSGIVVYVGWEAEEWVLVVIKEIVWVVSRIS